MVPLIGYVDRFSARPGERIAVKVSSQFDRPYQADLVRIVHGDANPAGPGIKLEDVPAAFAGTYRSRFQPVHSGSCGVVAPAPPLTLPGPCTIVVRVQPWLLDGRRQTVLAVEGGLSLSVAADGAVLELAGRRCQVGVPMLERALVRIARHRSRRPPAPAPDRLAPQLGRRRFRRGGACRYGRRRPDPAVRGRLHRRSGAARQPALRVLQRPHRGPRDPSRCDGRPSRRRRNAWHGGISARRFRATG